MSFIDFGETIEVKTNEPLCKHSTFRIGGNAEYAVFPQNTDELIYAINVCKSQEKKYVVVGNGSNLLFDDEGFAGVVIFTSKMDSCEYIYKDESVYIKSYCGKMLTELASEAGKKHSLTGLEFAYGIPGTIGGAVYMNAGAYGGQMSDVIVETEYLDTNDGHIKKLALHEQNLSYRHSIFQDHSDYVIISTMLRLTNGNAEEIFALMNKNLNARKDKQPLELPNAGSTFKRPAENIFVGKLIQDAGLKGYTVGGAQISEKHAGFTVNIGGATSRDVLTLIDNVKNIIQEKYDVSLESEIIYIPYN